LENWSKFTVPIAACTAPGCAVVADIRVAIAATRRKGRNGTHLRLLPRSCNISTFTFSLIDFCSSNEKIIVAFSKGTTDDENFLVDNMARCRDTSSEYAETKISSIKKLHQYHSNTTTILFSHEQIHNNNIQSHHPNSHH
jgi:hypothetical protein